VLCSNRSFKTHRFWTISVGQTDRGTLLFCCLAVFDQRVGHTMDVLSPCIPVLCHSDWLFHGESCPRIDVVYSDRAVHGIPRLCAPGIVPCIISFYGTPRNSVEVVLWTFHRVFRMEFHEVPMENFTCFPREIPWCIKPGPPFCRIVFTDHVVVQVIESVNGVCACSHDNGRMKWLLK